MPDITLKEHLIRAGKANRGKPKSAEHRAKLAAVLAKARAAHVRAARQAAATVDVRAPSAPAPRERDARPRELEVPADVEVVGELRDDA